MDIRYPYVGAIASSTFERAEKLYTDAVAAMEKYSGKRADYVYNDEPNKGCCVLLQKGWWVPEIQNVHFNNPVTVVIWADGTKTIVRAQNNEPFDPEKGLTMAITKKALGNKGTYYDTIKKWVEKYESPLNIDEYCNFTIEHEGKSL